MLAPGLGVLKGGHGAEYATLGSRRADQVQADGQASGGEAAQGTLAAVCPLMLMGKVKGRYPHQGSTAAPSDAGGMLADSGRRLRPWPA